MGHTDAYGRPLKKEEPYLTKAEDKDLNYLRRLAANDAVCNQQSCPEPQDSTPMVLLMFLIPLLCLLYVAIARRFRAPKGPIIPLYDAPAVSAKTGVRQPPAAY